MLTTLAEFKSYNGIADSTNDTLISTCISSSEAYVNNYCNRTLESSSYTEYHYGKDDCVMYLNQKPINTVNYIQEYNGSSYVAFVTSSVRIENENNRIIVYDTDFIDDYEYKISYNAGYTSATLPQDIKTVIFEIASFIFNQSAPVGVARLAISSMNMGSATSEGQSYMDFATMNSNWQFVLDGYKLITIT